MFGWSDPSSAPPESSIPIPLDTGDVDQTKSGGLKVKSLTTTGAIGVGVDAPAKPLDVLGDIHATGDICTDSAGGKCLSAVESGSNGYSLHASDGDPSDALIVDNEGKVGVGTTSPDKLLHLKATQGQLKIENPNSGGGYWIVGQSDDVWSAGGRKLVFMPDTSDTALSKVVFTNSGSVGIGTLKPSAVLVSINLNFSVGI